jgi:hypothetical protein
MDNQSRHGCLQPPSDRSLSQEAPAFDQLERNANVLCGSGALKYLYKNSRKTSDQEIRSGLTIGCTVKGQETRIRTLTTWPEVALKSGSTLAYLSQTAAEPRPNPRQTLVKRLPNLRQLQPSLQNTLTNPQPELSQTSARPGTHLNHYATGVQGRSR